MSLTRRAFLSAIASSCAAARLAALIGSQGLPAPPGGLVRMMPLGRFDGAPAPPLGRLLGRCLDARQFADLW